VKFDSSIFVVVAIFGVAFFLLKFFLFDRMLRILKRREQRVSEARSLWEAANARFETAVEGERQKLIGARRAAAASREAVRREALDQRAAKLHEADTAARRELEQATAELDAQRAREERTLASRAATLAGRINERLVGRAV
jgi:F0F1-type ATP synthase membrane subunit b/b'